VLFKSVVRFPIGSYKSPKPIIFKSPFANPVNALVSVVLLAEAPIIYLIIFKNN